MVFPTPPSKKAEWRALLLFLTIDVILYKQLQLKQRFQRLFVDVGADND